MKFNTFCQNLKEVEATTLRLEITQILTKLFKELEKKEVVNSFYLLQGKLKPSYDSLEFMISEKTIIKSLALFQQEFNNDENSNNLFGYPSKEILQANIVQKFKKLGDLSEVALNISQNFDKEKSEFLTINQVYDKLFEIAEFSGNGSQEEKIVGLKNLFRLISPLSAKIVVKIILGKLRLGFSTMTLIDALSWTMTDGKHESKLIEKSYQKKTNLAFLAKDYLFIEDEKKRLNFLNEVSTEILIPISSALCQRLDNWQEIIEKMENVVAEPKYDGMRCQIHYQKSQGKPILKVFTRSLEDISFMFPELEKAFINHPAIENIILDSEVVGINKNGGFLPFQETMKRKRKHSIEEISKEIPVNFFIFDCLHLNNQSLINLPLLKRKKFLQKLDLNTNLFQTVNYQITKNPEILKTYHQEQLELGLEGIIVKKDDSTYPLGRKGFLWVKIKNKEGEISQLNDTLDLIVVGYYVGKGKRTKFGLGAFLVGLLNNQNEVVSISKIGTGLSDEQFHSIYEKLEKMKTSKKPSIYSIPKGLTPDFWVEPKLVVEIAADAITKSNLHTSGFGLRFPRLVKIREDKDLNSLTKVEELEGIGVSS
jgi:DNA ligase-1